MDDRSAFAWFVFGAVAVYLRFTRDPPSPPRLVYLLVGTVFFFSGPAGLFAEGIFRRQLALTALIVIFSVAFGGVMGKTATLTCTRLGVNQPINCTKRPYFLIIIPLGEQVLRKNPA
jgi:hypothetical protein